MHRHRGQRHPSLLEQSVIPPLQERQCDTTTVFMQNGAPPHIARCVKQMFRRHSGDDRIISRHFPTTCPSRSTDLNLCDF
ncbi:uncharacterized protein TNCV_1875561 [Trichonephila clavipes]|nr:uncharacterized protein TNCV_1875561 [Trichonephila clavipes]